ncbi:MAG: hypothetical protein AVDCRST_MAG02-3866, partial [uncultured Rubrobacteraceae bacterium]
ARPRGRRRRRGRAPGGRVRPRPRGHGRRCGGDLGHRLHRAPHAFRGDGRCPGPAWQNPPKFPDPPAGRKAPDVASFRRFLRSNRMLGGEDARRPYERTPLEVFL